jgi:DNA-binding response OmpR family regulator
MKALIIEDDSQISKNIQDFLSQNALTVDVAND